MDKTVYFHYHRDDNDPRKRSMREDWMGGKPETEKERIEIFKYIFAHLFYNIFDCYNDEKAMSVHDKYFFHDDFFELLTDLKSRL